VFAVASLPRSRKGQGQIKSALAVAPFGLDASGADTDDSGACEAVARTRNRMGEPADVDVNTDGGGAGVAVDTWVNRDTETDADDDAGVEVWQGDIDQATVQ